MQKGFLFLNFPSQIWGMVIKEWTVAGIFSPLHFVKNKHLKSQVISDLAFSQIYRALSFTEYTESVLAKETGRFWKEYLLFFFLAFFILLVSGCLCFNQTAPALALGGVARLLFPSHGVFKKPFFFCYVETLFCFDLTVFQLCCYSGYSCNIFSVIEIKPFGYYLIYDSAAFLCHS